MDNQATFFDDDYGFDYRKPAHQRGSETSEAAAEAIEPTAGSLRAVVLDWLRANPSGWTDDEMQVALNMNPSTQRPRRIELIASGHVYDSGKKRATRSGRNAVIWKSTGKAQNGR